MGEPVTRVELPVMGVRQSVVEWKVCADYQVEEASELRVCLVEAAESVQIHVLLAQ